MSSHHQAHSQRRTSERRRLKLLRRNDEYRVANPFRHPCAPPFPLSLSQQLKRIEFLSVSAIAQICFDARTHDHDSPEGMLARMHEAVELQELRYCDLIGAASLPADPHQLSEQEEGGKAEPEEEVVQTKDEVSRNIYNVFDPRDPRRQEEFGCDTPLPGEAVASIQPPVACPSAIQTPCGGPAMLAQQEYQNYFAN